MIPKVFSAASPEPFNAPATAGLGSAPIVGLAVVGAASAGLRHLAVRKGRELWSGLAVLRSLNGARRVIGFVLIAVFA